MFLKEDAFKPTVLICLQQLHRSWNLIESFAVSFVAMNFIGGVRYAEPTQCPAGSGLEMTP